MSLAGQWDTVNGEVLMCPTVQISMDHDHQLERYSISEMSVITQSLMTVIDNCLCMILVMLYRCLSLFINDD